MNKSKQFLALLMIPCVLATASGCSSANQGGMDTGLFQQLKTGFKADGVITINNKYYDHKGDAVESETIPSNTIKYNLITTYTNTKDYTGNDYKLYKLDKDNKKTYESSLNAFSKDNYLYFNQNSYDNILRNDLPALDEYDNKVPYATNTSINPFTIIKSGDFKVKNNSYTLDKVKSSLVVNALLDPIMEVSLNVAIDNFKMIVEDNVLKTIQGQTKPYNEIETIESVNYSKVSTVDFVFNISEIGTANARNEIGVEPHKKENDNLGKAIKNLAKAESFRVNRHFTTPLAKEEETIDIYFDGKAKSIYMAVYDMQYGPRPAQPTGADALLTDSKKENDGKLNAYMYQPSIHDERVNKWKLSADLGRINNLFEYNDYTLINLDKISQEVFNKNEDGSYTPIPELMPLMATEIFCPFLAATSELANGYVNTFKLYLTADGNNIDRIELDTQVSNIIGHVTLSYDQFGTCVIPFDALNNIEE